MQMGRVVWRWGNGLPTPLTQSPRHEEAAMKSQVTSLFVLLLLPFIATGQVSSGSIGGDQMVTAVQSDERYIQDAHLARYQEHLLNLGFYGFICR
jgi:hypothetical protein